MTIKYSPKLSLRHGVWYSDDWACWLCDDGLRNNWRVGSAKRCWIGLSSTPVRGAMEISVFELGSLFAHTKPHSKPAGHSFDAYYSFLIFLQSYGTSEVVSTGWSKNSRSVWLWIEIPNE